MVLDESLIVIYAFAVIISLLSCATMYTTPVAPAARLPFVAMRVATS